MTTIESARETETQATPDTSNGDGAARGVDWENPRVSAILAAAAKCFARKGFSATTLAEIGKELGLRKSIVHYYFASKAALIHEVQAYSQHKYLERVKDAIRATAAEEPKKRMMSVLGSLWEVLENNRTTTHLNIEVWSASRRDPELRRRASMLQRDARQLISDGVGDVLGIPADQFPQMQALSTLILAVLNGLVVAEYLEGEDSNAKEAYDTFLYLLRLGMKKMEEQASA